MKQSTEFNDISQQRGAGIKSSNTFSGNSFGASKNKIINTDANKENKNTSARYEKAKKVSQTTGSLLTKVAVIVGAGILGVTGVEAIIPPSFKAHIEEVWAYESEVYYAVSMEEYSDDVYVVLYNDFTNREEKVEEQSYSGVFEHLAANMYYTLAIKKGNKVIVKQQVYTSTRDLEKEDPYYDDTGQNQDPQTADGEPVTEDPSTSDGQNVGRN